MPSSIAAASDRVAAVIGLPARTRATARNRNSGGYGRGMERSLSAWLDLHTEMGKILALPFLECI